jgi:CspA family cold shock protein
MKPQHSGRIDWFSREKGFGFISRPGKRDIYVHITGLTGAGPRELNAGDEVSFDEQPGDERGPRAVNVIVNLRAPEKPYVPRTRE